ncbi:hypothetical protein ACHAXS_013392 [Conticribra weissflogii]
MLLEEALAGSNSAVSGTSSRPGPGTNNGNDSSRGNGNLNGTLPPNDAALALLSFLRDELPAGGAAAEKRFVTLFPLIVDRVFGNLVSTGPAGLSNSTVNAGNAATSGQAGASSLPTLDRGNYRHADGGWLSLRDVPRNPQSPATPSRSHSSGQRTISPESDPIIRLLRAPRLYSGGGGIISNYAPTLLDAMSAESVHRPNIRFKFPLGGLPMNTVDVWRVFVLGENSSGPAGRGGGGMAGSSFASRAFGRVQDVAYMGGSLGGNLTENRRHTPDFGNENATRLLDKLLSASPAEQVELKMYFLQGQQQQQQFQQSGVGVGVGSPYPKATFGASSPISSPVPRSSPLASKTTQSRSHQSPIGMMTSSSIKNLNDPHFELTMLEYYLLIFVRFPLAHPALFGDTGSSSANSDGRSGNGVVQRGGTSLQYSSKLRTNIPPYGYQVYSRLFSSYLSYYLPHGLDYANGGLTDGDDAFQLSEVGITCFENCVSLDRTSELFLRLIIELWLGGYNVAPTTTEALDRYRRIRRGMMKSSGNFSSNSFHENDKMASPTLNDSMEMAQPLKCPFKPAPSQIQCRIHDLVRHLVSDRSLRNMVQSASLACQRQLFNEQNGLNRYNDAPGDDEMNENTDTTEDFDDGAKVGIPRCLTTPMTAIQPHIYNYVRLALACGPIHTADSIFHRALETWLIYLEPWNYVLKKRVLPIIDGMRGSVPPQTNRAGEFLRNAAATVASSQRYELYPSYVVPRPHSKSAYTSQWEAYVASNLHLYTVPLAIFLKRAREFDFSSNNNHSRSLALIQRVFRIYNKPLVNVINKILNKKADAVTQTLIARHEENLGVYSPPNDWKFSSCQGDAIILLEEIFMQHRKRTSEMDLIDRLGEKFDSLFSGNTVMNEETALKNIVAQIQYLVDLPPDYEVLPEDVRKASWFRALRVFERADANDRTKAFDNGWSTTPERGPDGKITDRGREQIAVGLRKCNPLDVRYIGDPMLSRVKSYEVSALVDLTVSLSKYLNKRLGLVPDVTGDELDARQKLFLEMERYKRTVFRINLRFLADPRNVILLSILFWFVLKVYSTRA